MNKNIRYEFGTELNLVGTLCLCRFIKKKNRINDWKWQKNCKLVNYNFNEPDSIYYIMTWDIFCMSLTFLNF